MSTFNSISINPIKIIEGKEYYSFRKVLFAYTFNTNITLSNERKKISACNIIKRGVGRANPTLINIDGVVEWISFRHNISSIQKKQWITELIEQKLIAPITIPIFTRKENEFMDNLKLFLAQLNIDIKLQYSICDYIVDGFIDNKYVIEFDENDHKSYDKTNESKRTKDIEGLGYTIIRVSDNNTLGYNIGYIAKHIFNKKKSVGRKLKKIN